MNKHQTEATLEAIEREYMAKVKRLRTREKPNLRGCILAALIAGQNLSLLPHPEITATAARECTHNKQYPTLDLEEVFRPPKAYSKALSAYLVQKAAADRAEQEVAKALADVRFGVKTGRYKNADEALTCARAVIAGM